MRRIVALFVLSLTLLAASAQDVVDQKSITILEKVSSIYKNSTGTKVDMRITITDGQNKGTNSATGILKTRGNMFHLSSSFATMIFDSKDLYVYSASSGEVTISTPDKKELTSISPTSMIDAYKEGYKVQAPDEVTESGVKVYSINIFPENRDEEFFKINIKVNCSNYHPVSITSYLKNGTTTKIAISKIEVNKDYNNSTFTFNAKDFKDAEIIDIR